MTVQQAFDLALQHHQAGRLVEAEALYRQILAVQPNHFDALHMLGVIATQVGHMEQATQMIRQAIGLNPNDSAAHSNLGNALCGMDRRDEAISSYRRAIELNPNFPDAYNNLGMVLVAQGLPDEAAVACRRAIQLRPNSPEAQNNLGNALRQLGQIDETIAAYRAALQCQPDYASAHSNLIFALHFDPDADASAIAEEQRRWGRHFEEPIKRFIQPHSNDRQPDRRLKVGYVSPEFCARVVGLNLLRFFQSHNHRDFEILCYSEVTRPDQFTEAFRRCADYWRSTPGLSDDALANQIRHDGVDILVDLTQHASGNRLPMFARRPAPVQVSFAGYPETTGLEAIQYRISDRWLESEPELKIEDGTGSTGSWHASEIGWKREAELRTSNSDLRTAERVYLIDSFWCYDPCGVEAEVNDLPAKTRGYVTFGCLNSFCKINDAVLRLWARVLRNINNSRLTIMSGLGSHRQLTVEFLERESIEPHRVEFVEWRPRQEYLEMYHRLDIVLDTFPYNGHTTSLDALWMGVPVVSLAGERAVSRAGLSQLSNLGLPELVAHSEDEYVEIATRLARDLPRLAELRQTLRSRMEVSVLMDAPRFARQIEAAYRAMWRRWCAETPSNP